ncbi:transporter substrate-binding domain-containing protein [Cytobacillus sp. IB215316]|uniref:transporter substrate-binding domain-containing protein n=1 Tax=Cytobacillus sp. IB215316 TaxID=3097354 RepID=UPI002A184877|nr:transporter substrate-binding domain-containing protein [Cytobacillus sp. IB215316]MDX8360976.1 transporter substrate-binding domain-containing protein [Cytobacillus sp. IB215316]
MRKRYVVLMLLLVVIFSTACGTNETTNSSGADQNFDLVEQGKLTWASSGLYKPFNYSENGELKGFDVEIGYALAEKLGLEPNPVTTPWETILQGLKGEKFDIILGSMAITDDRLKQVNFTDPYYYSGGTVFVSDENKEIKSADDLAGKRIGVVAQSTYDEAAKKYTDDIKYYNSDVTALNDLTVKGRLDAVITDSIVGFEAQAAGLTIKEAGDRLWVERIGIAVRKDDEELLEALNEVLEEIVTDGTYVDISNDFFGTNLLDVNLEGVEIYK